MCETVEYLEKCRSENLVVRFCPAFVDTSIRDMDWEVSRYEDDLKAGFGPTIKAAYDKFKGVVDASA